MQTLGVTSLSGQRGTHRQVRRDFLEVPKGKIVAFKSTCKRLAMWNDRNKSRVNTRTEKKHLRRGRWKPTAGLFLPVFRPRKIKEERKQVHCGNAPQVKSVKFLSINTKADQLQNSRISNTNVLLEVGTVWSRKRFLHCSYDHIPPTVSTAVLYLGTLIWVTVFMHGIEK